MRVNDKKRDPIPRQFKSVAEAAEFWDNHDLADYWDLTQPATLEIDIQRRVFLTALEPELAKKLVVCARQQGVTTETLINVWLSEKLASSQGKEQMPARARVKGRRPSSAA